MYSLQEQHARELLRDRAGAGALAGEHVLDGRDDDARDAQAEVLLEVGVLGGDDRLPQHRRHVVVADDDAALGGELADHLAVAREEAGDRVRLVVVERADLGQVVGVGEEHAAERAEQRGDQEQGDEDRLLRHADDDASSARRGPVGGHHLSLTARRSD